MVHAIKNYVVVPNVFFFSLTQARTFPLSLDLAFPATPTIGVACTSASSRKNSSVSISQLLPESIKPKRCLTRCDYRFDLIKSLSLVSLLTAL